MFRMKIDVHHFPTYQVRRLDSHRTPRTLYTPNPQDTDSELASAVGFCGDEPCGELAGSLGLPGPNLMPDRMLDRISD